ncbi:TetR/AcrR family transcriptional regulator [Paenibacillus sp. 481]|nr:TetR/AcrR family transcriptional regulator [Paenibacillus sp. 481]
MSAKVGNLRHTRTRKSLIDAFIELASEKDFEKITVLDLTERASVNRATFYAHFQDKVDLIDAVISDSATSMLEKRTEERVQFNVQFLQQLVLAVCDYHQHLKGQCKRSYMSIAPLLKEKMLEALQLYLTKSLADIYTESERQLYVPIYAAILYEAGHLWGTEQVAYNSRELAERTAKLILPY